MCIRDRAITSQQAQLAQLKSELESEKLEREAAVKAQLMEQEFMYNMKLRQMEVEAAKIRDNSKEDRKDQRAQQAAEGKKFESAGNDVVGGGFNLGAFEPK